MDDQREKALSGIVRADDGERWEFLVQALNDLGSVGFEVETPIYGSVPKGAGAGQIIEAFLLASRSATVASDLERRIKRTKALVADAENHLTTLSSDMERALQGQRVRELHAELRELEERRRSSTTGVESTDAPDKTSARMTELAEQAARHFEQNDFDKALSALKELQKITEPRDKT